MATPWRDARQRRRLARLFVVEAVINRLAELDASPPRNLPADAKAAYHNQIELLRDLLLRTRMGSHLGRAPRAWIEPARSMGEEMSAADE